MKRGVLLLVVVAAVGAGIAMWPRGGADSIVTVKVGDTPRVFRLHVPGRLSRPAPLVLSFHGWGSSAAQHQLLTGFDALADREGFVVAYPEGIGAMASFNAVVCCGEAVRRGVDDVALAREVIAEVERQLPIDGRRVYATGFSNGGFLAHRLACLLSEELAAVASVGASDPTPDCVPAQAISVLELHGTRDDRVRWEGGGLGQFIAIEPALRGWAKRAGCGEAREVTLSKGEARCEAWRWCAGGAEVALCRIEGGGHTWPGGPDVPELGATTSDLDATREIWRFLSRHAQPLHGDTAPAAR